MSRVVSPVLCRRPSMNTWFEIILPGDDVENLSAAGEAALDEIQRVEKLLSRFDPASEVFRINNTAAREPVLVDFELAAILETCREARQQTDGFFDITAGSGAEFDEIEFNSAARLVAFRNPALRLDFGAFGKGFALDCATALLRDSGIKHALLHGGTSSVFALGSQFGGVPWRVGLLCPGEENVQVELSDTALSTSATKKNNPDILNPKNGKPIRIPSMCSVICDSAAWAEIYSTAFLCMGKNKATEFLSLNPSVSTKVFWSHQRFTRRQT